MSYSNYLIDINGHKLPNVSGMNIFSIDSYTCRDAEVQEVGSWKDANGKDHVSNFPHKKTTITFSIAERTMSQHESLAWLWSLSGDITVNYWSDKACDYKNGTFKINPIEFNHKWQNGQIYYNATTVTFEEY